MIMLVFCQAYIFGQNWVSIPKTKIKFSHLIDDDQKNWYVYSYEYFQKGDTLIAVRKDLAKDFYDLFSETPKAFNDIYNSAFNKTTTLYEHSLDFDSTIKRISFKTGVIIGGREIIYGHNEIIWRLNELSWSYFNDPCYIHIVFSKIVPKTKKTKQNYLLTFLDHCTI
jgi:hypothetical protein